MNILSFILFGWDKRLAIRHKDRIPERTLLLFAFLGGALGAMLGMWCFHHKTLHWKFQVLIPIFLLLQLLSLLWATMNYL